MYTLSTCVNEIPPLFCQLDVLENTPANEYLCWKEQARWIRFEEQAEKVCGRWSKPHVASIPQTAIENLRNLLYDGTIMFDLNLTSLVDITAYVADSLKPFFDHSKRDVQLFMNILRLPHYHHHLPDFDIAKSQTSIANLSATLSLVDLQNLDQGGQHVTASSVDTKENSKFRRKVNRKAEGASILIAPVDFAQQSKILFIRFQAATAIPSLFELNLSARFMVIIIGPVKRKPYLYEIGRAMATCLADDLCRELFYAANKRDDLIDAVNYLSRSTMALPPSSWDPKIRIEPPDRYMSKKDRTDAHDITEYIHDERVDEDSHVDPSLKADKIPFSGLVMDIRRKLPWIVSDITDCLNVKCIAATIYMYLVSLCSLVAFGALLGQNTDDCMATMECILAGAISGILFALFSGQPLNLLSATGPMLILENIIATLCKKFSFDFLEFRLWIGLWIALFLLLMVMFNLSFLVKFITRFTEDCFASLVAIMFIIDAIKSVVKINSMYPMYGAKSLMDSCSCIESNSTNTSTPGMDTTLFGVLVPGVSSLTNCLALNGEWRCEKVSKQYYPDIFIFSVLLFIIGFLICICLKHFRDSPFFPSSIRQILSDFAVLISILIISVINALVGINTPKLTVPAKFSPTRDDRTWLIPFFGKNPWWTIFLAIPPAIIATLLVFMDQQITAVIVNRKEFKLKKGFGYHLDLLIVAIQIAVCSILGLPWFVAATVLALTHVNALKEMSENSAPGEKPTFLGVREQRVTSLLTSILIGLSVFFTKVLSYIPMSVLYAVFLNMGVSALGGLELIDRVLLIFMPSKYQPDYKFLRHVNSNRVHLFTLIQVLSIAGMFTVLLFAQYRSHSPFFCGGFLFSVLFLQVKSIDAIAITFPLLVVATCGVRKLMDYVFTQNELFWLDQLLPSATNKHNESHVNICDGKTAGFDNRCYNDDSNENESSMNITL